MNWDIKFAKKLKRYAVAQRSSGSFSGVVVQASPLVVSAFDGEIMLQDDRLHVSDTITELHTGDRVCVVGTGPYTVVARI